MRYMRKPNIVGGVGCDMGQDEYVDTFSVGDNVITKYGDGVVRSTGTFYEEVSVVGKGVSVCDLRECIKSSTAFRDGKNVTCWDKMDKRSRTELLQGSIVKTDCDAMWHDIPLDIRKHIMKLYDERVKVTSAEGTKRIEDNGQKPENVDQKPDNLTS